MNDIQKTVFDSFQCFVSICEKLNLEFYLANGSALGAKKYGGFIPWDDDLDVVMPRRDYEIFLANAQKLLPEHLFLQNYRSDKEFPFLYSKIRNSKTAFIETSVKHLKMNHGIYLDVFPLDAVEDDFINNKLNSYKIKVLFWLAFCALKDKSKIKVRLRNFILRLFGFHKRTYKALKKLEKFVCNEKSETKYCCNYADRQRKGLMLREWYGKGSECTFEGITVRIPEKFDEYLTYKYGDWRSDLPLNEQKSHHKAEICDTERTYKEYLK